MTHDNDHPTTDTAAMVDDLLASTAKHATIVRVPEFGTLRRRGGIWQLRYSNNGRRIEESSKTDDLGAALRQLKQRVQAIGKGQRDPAAEGRVRMGELFDALKTDYENNGHRSLRTLGFRLAPLREVFGQDRARNVTATRIARYMRDRLDAGKARATVNRELAALRRAFALAVEQERLTAAPKIKMLAENNARQGFVDAATFETIVAALPEHLQDVARFGFVTGWRVREITTLEWSEVDRAGQRITLRRERSKNREPRVVPIVPLLAQILERRGAVRQTPAGPARLVFHHRHGRPILDFRGAWRNAVKAAGMPGLLFHDLRRSAVRNLVSAGVDESVAMKITGHKTNSVFKRYRIVDENDMRAALAKVETALRGKREAPAGQ